MSVTQANRKLNIIMVLTSVALFATSAFGQSATTGHNSTGKGIAPQGSRLGNPEDKVTASEPKPGNADNKVSADEPKRKDLQSEVETMKAENAAVRELLRRMEAQQRALLEQVDRLKRRLDGGTETVA